MQIFVRDNNVDQAMKVLKKKMQREGIFRELKRKRYYEKPSEARAREKGEAVRRAREARAEAGTARGSSSRAEEAAPGAPRRVLVPHGRTSVSSEFALRHRRSAGDLSAAPGAVALA